MLLYGEEEEKKQAITKVSKFLILLFPAVNK